MYWKNKLVHCWPHYPMEILDCKFNYFCHFPDNFSQFLVFFKFPCDSEFSGQHGHTYTRMFKSYNIMFINFSKFFLLHQLFIFFREYVIYDIYFYSISSDRAITFFKIVMKFGFPSQMSHSLEFLISFKTIWISVKRI